MLRRVDPQLIAWISGSPGVLFFALVLALALRLVLRLVPYEPNFTIDFDYYVLAARSCAARTRTRRPSRCTSR
jgi:hypothetical protein